MGRNRLRILFGASCLPMLVSIAPVSADQLSDNSARSLERVSAALAALPAQQALKLPAKVEPTSPVATHLGLLTLLPPDDARGEIIRVRVPVGALVMRAVRSVSSAQYRRRDRRAGERVQRDLQAFLDRRATP